jgi:acyl-CoA reductase-like NAD-dependent aldehyde dehydrogenase
VSIVTYISKAGERASITFPDLFEDATTGSGAVPELKMLIAGEWRRASSGETFDVSSPVDGNVIARAQKSGAEDVEGAIRAARDARAEFKSLSAADRLEICKRAAHIMEEHHQAFIDAVVIDLGKTPSQAESEVNSTIERLELAREEVRKIFGEYLPGDWIADTEGKAGIVLREPVGTVAAIGPFNYPLFLSASKIIPALAAGNTVVAKAPSDDPIALMMFCRVLQEAGLPDGVLNMVTGRGAEIGDLFASHDDVSMISFTGSTSVGRGIAAQAGPKPLHLELGGNAAGIVLSDADIELAVEKTVMGAFKNAGQRCDAISRALVEDSVYDDYVARVVNEAGGWKLGDPRAEDTKVGPLVNDGAVRHVNDLVKGAASEGAEVLLGGGVDATYHEATVLADVPLDADIVWEETFGPVIPITPSRSPTPHATVSTPRCSRRTSTRRGKPHVGSRSAWSRSTMPPPTASATSRSEATSRTRGSGARAWDTRSTSARCSRPW